MGSLLQCTVLTGRRAAARGCLKGRLHKATDDRSAYFVRCQARRAFKQVSLAGSDALSQQHMRMHAATQFQGRMFPGQQASEFAHMSGKAKTVSLGGMLSRDQPGFLAPTLCAWLCMPDCPTPAGWGPPCLSS